MVGSISRHTDHDDDDFADEGRGTSSNGIKTNENGGGSGGGDSRTDNDDEWTPLNGDSNDSTTPGRVNKNKRFGSSSSSSLFDKGCGSYCNPFDACHQAKAGELWSSLVFGWFDPVIQTMQHKLDTGVSPNLDDDEHIPPLPPDDRAADIDVDFERLWSNEQTSDRDASSSSSLARCLWTAFSPMFIRAGFLKAVHDCLQFVGPKVLNGLIEFLRDPTEPLGVGLALTAAVTVAQLGMSLCLRHYFFMCYRVGIKVRTAVLMAIYKKALKIDSTYYKKHPVGQVTNLMSVDVERLQGVIPFLHAIWYSFLQIVLAMYFLWQQLGPSCLAGVLVIVLSIPLTAVTASWMGKLQKKLMEAKDNRVDVNQETVANMKVVKLQAWEEPFRDKITKLRDFELWRLFSYDVGQSCTQLLWSSVPLLIALTTFGAYVVIAGKVRAVGTVLDRLFSNDFNRGVYFDEIASHSVVFHSQFFLLVQSLDVAVALTSLALFEILRFPLFMLPYVINMTVEAGVSLKRIQDFLSAPDHKPPPTLPPSATSIPSPVIRLRDTTVTYEDLRSHKSSGSSSKLSLKDQIENTEDQLLLIKAKLADAEERLAELADGQHSNSKVRSYGTKHATGISDSDMFDKSEKLLSLRHIDFEVLEGEFVAIVGSVGSGKSTLLKSILGELQLVSGDVMSRDQIAYFDQKPFIMNDTVKGNIIFGKDEEGSEDADLYRLSIEAACLQHDLDMLGDGDQTEIGEKGITLRYVIMDLRLCILLSILMIL
jgi:ABC-type multidrug transport system fused ATPase/permease subunit